MSLMVAPELVAAAAADLTGIGQAISAANAAAAGPTTQVLAAAGDEVSAAIAALRCRRRSRRCLVPTRRSTRR